jgi:hypothetical protein
MGQRRNVTDRRKPKHSKKNLSQYHPVHHRCHIDWAGVFAVAALHLNCVTNPSVYLIVKTVNML